LEGRLRRWCATVTWSLSFRLRQYLKGSLWVLPLCGAVVGVILGELVPRVDRAVGVPSYWQYSPSTASTVLSAIVGAMAALTGFVVTVSVLVVQMATGMFSARYMRLWYRDRMLKVLLAVLVGTLTFSFALLRHVETDQVPDIGVTAAGVLVVVSLILFLLFLDRSLHRLRPVAVAALVARQGRRSVEAAVHAAAAPDAPDFLSGPYETTNEPTVVVRSDRAGAIQAMNTGGLMRFARTHDCLLVLRHVVGDFVPAGATLAVTYGGTLDRTAADRELQCLIALGVERTIEQDPAFAIRIMVDIANKALSPAVNDPTTAVQVINHLGETLRLIGTTELGRAKPGDEGRRRWVVIPTRSWEDFLALGVTEIRLFGASSVQVTRRLRAVLEELRGAVLPEHRSAVEDELARLDATVKRAFGGAVDLDRAGRADDQGLGGPAAHWSVR
jgi:uncharacterized membrane protein